MNYILKIKDAEIPLNIQNYKKSKSIKLYFKEGILKVTKSPYVPKREVDKLIKNNEEKIYEEYKKIEEKKRLNNVRWKNGATILYKGEEYSINKDYDEKNSVRININEESKIFEIQLPLSIKKTKEEEKYILNVIRKLFKNNTEAIIQKRLPYWSNITKINYTRVNVKDAKTRYGSCVPSKKALHFSSRLVMLPNEAIDAVIVHELCHIIHPNHSKNFYDLVEKYIPNYKQIDKYLKKNGKLITI